VNYPWMMRICYGSIRDVSCYSCKVVRCWQDSKRMWLSMHILLFFPFHYVSFPWSCKMIICTIMHICVCVCMVLWDCPFMGHGFCFLLHGWGAELELYPRDTVVEPGWRLSACIES
jgi:hypothetical protein